MRILHQSLQEFYRTVLVQVLESFDAIVELGYTLSVAWHLPP
ncbi:hypothetical protein PVA44_00400 [Entomospira nematocerorum]|nr:hypothetical protein [Entomospira nematocera]WDI33960.1 hypothetical protein PVA44_00400 [Entomospira nematocera]